MSTGESIVLSDKSHASAWRSLVDRSILAWTDLLFVTDGKLSAISRMTSYLRSYASIDEFLDQAPSSAMFWFFQRREAFLAQERMRNWDRDSLDDYVVIPATSGFVSRRDCFFVSHYWRCADHPDPDGQYLRLFQGCLGPQIWSYVWLDWTCTPQAPRSQAEEKYFFRSLETVSSLIRNCGFVWFYPPFEPRLWILYEIAEFLLTAEDVTLATDGDEDIREFESHVREMCQSSVRSILRKYDYRCKNDLDKAFLTSWLELLVLFKQLNADLVTIRTTLDLLTWAPTTQSLYNTGVSLQLDKYQGRLTYKGEIRTFTPFPRWVSLFVCVSKARRLNLLTGSYASKGEPSASRVIDMSARASVDCALYMAIQSIN